MTSLIADFDEPEREHHIRSLGLRVRERGIDGEIRDMLRAGFAVGRDRPAFIAAFLRSHLAIDKDTRITVCGRAVAAQSTPAPLPWILPIVCRRCLIIWAEEHRRWLNGNT